MSSGTTITIQPNTTYTPILKRSFVSDSKLDREMKARVGKELMNWPKAMRPMMAVLPLGLLEGLLASDFKEGLLQSLQEILIQLLPRGGINALVVRRSWPMFADECFLEIAEYLAMYILPTVFATMASHPISRALKLPHYELLGKRMYGLEKDLGKTFEVGTIRPINVHLDRPLLNKLAFGKLMTFLVAASVCGGCELMVPALRVVLTNQIFKTNNFYEISGLNVSDDSHNDGEEALNQAKQNIRNAVLFMGLAIPTLLGLTFALAGGASGKGSQGLYKYSKILDLSNKFGLSKVLISVGMAVSVYSYLSVTRNEAEYKEILDRVFKFAMPCVLFYKQIAGNILAFATGLMSGLGNILSPLKTYFNEAWGKEKGKRDILDFGLVDLGMSEKEADKQLEFDTQTNSFTERMKKMEEFDGKVTESKKAQELKLKDPEKYRDVMKRIKFMKDKAPYWLAFGIGLIINWFNFLRTAKMHEDETKGKNNEGDLADKDSSILANNIVTFNRNKAAQPISTSLGGLTSSFTA